MVSQNSDRLQAYPTFTFQQCQNDGIPFLLPGHPISLPWSQLSGHKCYGDSFFCSLHPQWLASGSYQCPVPKLPPQQIGWRPLLGQKGGQGSHVGGIFQTHDIHFHWYTPRGDECTSDMPRFWCQRHLLKSLPQIKHQKKRNYYPGSVGFPQYLGRGIQKPVFGH